MSGMLRVLELPARLQEELRSTPGIGYEMAQRIAQVGDSQFQEQLVTAAVAGESVGRIRERIASFRTTQGSTSSSRPKTRTSQLIQLTHREGNCVASLRAKRKPGAQEAMLEALRQLAEQVRADDSLR
ncbi:MAG: hypothetical protein HS117_06265 [Verrucomicrobiaceae bacterium]|nr:hypothetical protein [Verrucomicrobiaceae bacterium]